MGLGFKGGAKTKYEQNMQDEANLRGRSKGEEGGGYIVSRKIPPEVHDRKNTTIMQRTEREKKEDVLERVQRMIGCYISVSYTHLTLPTIYSV